MKRCWKCGRDKDDSEFNWKVKSIKRHGYCRDCQKTYSYNHYWRNVDQYRERAITRRREIRPKVKLWIWEYKATHPCVDCGENDPIVLDFHHIGVKTKTVSSMGIHSIETIREEIEKCVVLCANCHRRRHYNKDSGPIHPLASNE